MPHLGVWESIIFGSFSGHFGPKRTRKMAITGQIRFQCQKTQKPQKICENWVLLVFHSQNCWGIISSCFLLKHIGIWEFGHVLGSSRPLCGPTWSVMNFQNVRWVKPMNWGPGPYKVIIEKWPRIQLEVYWPHLICPLFVKHSKIDQYLMFLYEFLVIS